ncbi:hypothetical protein [Bacillus sp. C1]
MERKIDEFFRKTTRSKQIHECVLLIENTSGDILYSNGYGEKNIDTPLLMNGVQPHRHQAKVMKCPPK